MSMESANLSSLIIFVVCFECHGTTDLAIVRPIYMYQVACCCIMQTSINE